MKRGVTIICLFILMRLLAGCAEPASEKPLVIWVTGGLQGDFLPQSEYGQPQARSLDGHAEKMRSGISCAWPQARSVVAAEFLSAEPLL